MRTWLLSHVWAMVLVGLVSGIVGFSCAWIAWHLYADHLLFHQLLQLEINRENAVRVPVK